MVWCIGSDGHRALELPHQVGSIAKGTGENGSLGLVSSCSDVARSSTACVDTPVVSALPARSLSLSKADQEVFKPLLAIVSYIPVAASPRSLQPSRLVDSSLDFTSLDMLRVVILQI